jgi:hypothetical protein
VRPAGRFKRDAFNHSATPPPLFWETLPTRRVSG